MEHEWVNFFKHVDVRSALPKEQIMIDPVIVAALQNAQSVVV